MLKEGDQEGEKILKKLIQDNSKYKSLAEEIIQKKKIKMKFLIIIIISITLINCSFDNRTGIWKNENPIQKRDQFEKFEKLSITEKTFYKTINPPEDLTFKIKIKINADWNDVFYSKNNNLENFKYNENYRLISKSKKLSKYNINERILYKGNNAYLTDDRGNLIIFSVNENKVIKNLIFIKKI